MIRTVFALLALATLAKNDVSGRTRHACTAIQSRGATLSLSFFLALTAR